MRKYLLILIPLFAFGCNCAKYETLKTGAKAAEAPIHGEYLQWTDEKVAEGKLTANDGKIRHDSVEAAEANYDHK